MTRIAFAVLGVTLIGCAPPTTPPPPQQDLIFAAVEEDGTLAILDGASGELLRTVDLSSSVHGSPTRFEVHNVQAAPDGKIAWLTAMPSAEGGHAGAAMEEELIGVNVERGVVESRIALGEDLHAAHVVTTPTQAYVTANEGDSILVVDLVAKAVSRTIPLPDGSAPHGLRLTPDGSHLVVAGMGDGALLLVSTSDGSVTRFDLPGRVVQAAVLADGTAAFATIYDTRQVARLDLSSQQLRLFDLPPGSAGPVQLYPSPDSRSIWVADQGMLGSDPAGTSLVQLDTATGAIRRVANVDPAPHGVVLSEDGSKVWTTTLVNGTVQSLDTVTGAVLTTTPVGKKPNGISCGHASGVMP